MEYPVDTEWSMSIEGEEDEDALLFAEMRKVHRYDSSMEGPKLSQ